MWQIISKIINYYICAIISVTGVYLFLKIVLKEKPKITTKKMLFISQITYAIYIIIYACLNTLSKTIAMFLSNVLFSKKVFKLSNSQSILMMFIYTALLIISDLVSLFFVTIVLKINKEFCYEVIAGSIISNLLVSTILLTITHITKSIIQKIINNKIDHNIKVISLSVLTLISVLLFFYTIIKEYKVTNNIYIYLVAITVLVLVLFTLIKQTLDNYKLTREYDTLLEFMTTYENEIENQRILRHEVKNEFRTIRAKICDNQENKEIIEYIDEIVKDKYEVDKEKYAKFGYLPPNGIKGLFYFKTQEAERKNIKVAINISKRVKDSVIYNLNIRQQRDFGRIIGVILDNAIEASLESKKKQLGIEAYINLEREFKLIITNTFNNKIETTKIGKERFSTKGRNRGHGLLLVKQLVENNNILEIKTEIKEELYTQIITVKNVI